MENKYSAFAKQIMNKYENELPHSYYGLSLVHRKKRDHSVKVDVYRQMNHIFNREFYRRIRQYENRYYQTVTSQDNRKFIQTMEQIYNQPREKKQLIHLFKKLGVVTKNQEEWRETRQTMMRYEEELLRLKKYLEMQEESVVKRKKEEIQEISTKKVVREVLEHVKQEIKMERLRFGLD